LIPGTVSVNAKIGKVTGEATVETCCKADGSTGFKVTGTGSLSGEIELKYYLVGGELSRSWTDGVYNYEFTAGAGIPITATAGLTGGVEVSKECEGDLKACAFASLSLGVSVGPAIEGSLEMTQIVTGQTWKVGASARAQLETGVSGEVRYCIGEGFSGKVCFDGLKFVAEISATGGPVNVSYSFEKVLVDESCYPSGDGSALTVSLQGSSGPLTDDEIARLAGFDSQAALLAALDENPGPSAAVPTGPTAPNSLSSAAANPATKLGASCTSCGCGVIGPQARVEDVCATVRLRLDQEVTMTRTAFEGTLQISNRADQPIEDLQVFLSVMDVTSGTAANDRFAFSDPALKNVTVGRQDEDDVWYVIPANADGSLIWTLLPTDEAAPEGPTEYTVGGLMTYVLAGTQYTVPLFPAPITVYPDAALHIKYFHQRDVFSDDPFTDEIEPAIPYDLGILITNAGKGTAHNLTITSAQPRIIENEKGLLIDFEIIGAEVNGQPSPRALTSNFGQIGPGETHQGRWQLVSSLQGHFVEYSASFQHLTGFGDPRTSLIKQVQIYELIHTVLDARPGSDLLPDFLVNEIQDEENLPDTVHLSDGSVMPVGVGSVQSVSAAPRPGSMSVVVDAAMPDGWGYLRLDDPSDGVYRLYRVVRSDGTELLMDWNVWTTDRTFRFDGQRPIYENKIHLFDYGAGTYGYTLHFRLDDDIPPEVLDVFNVTPDPQEGPVTSVDVLFSEQIDLATFTFEDVTLRRNGGPNLIGPGVSIEHLAGGTYRIYGLGGLTDDEGFYELRVVGAGVADYAGNPGIGEAIERWVYGNAPPYIVALVGITQPARNTPVTAIELVFSEPIDLATLDAADLTLTRDGGSDLLTGELSLSEVVPGTYRLSGLTELTAEPGFYVLSLDATGIRDLEGSAGIGSESVSWTMDLSPPTILELQQVATSPRNTVVSSLDITFSEPVDPASFGREDLMLRRNGTGPDLIDYRVTIEQVDVAKYRIGGFHWVVGYEGTYELTVDAQGVADLAGNAGTGQATASWVMDTTPPAAPTNLRIDPDRGISDSDGRTNTATVTFSGEVAEQPLTVQLFNVTTETDLGRVEASEFMFSKTIILGTPGHHRLRAQAIDQAGNFSAASFFDVFIDLAPPRVATVLGGPAAMRTEPLGSLILVFTENVFGSDFDRGRLILTRDAGPNLIGETVTVSRLADDRFEITGLSDLTDQQGDYRLHLDLTGLSDAAGNTGTSFELRWQLQAALGEIGDWVWLDLNGDGIQDLEEVGFGGVTVRLYRGDGTYLQETVTDADGYYRFRNLSTAEFYFLEFAVPAGHTFSPVNQGGDSRFDSDADIQTGRTVTFTIVPGENLHWDAGLLRLGRISGIVWLDSDASGQRDGDERVLADQWSTWI
jgi:hypothetical protein